MSTNVTLEDIAYLAPKVPDMSLSMQDISTVPGELVQISVSPQEVHEEYYVHTEELKQFLIENYYKELKYD